MFTVRYIEEIDSTNSELKRQAMKGAPSGAVLVARRQTAGRGRMGRQFFSPADAGLYMSVLFRPVSLTDAGLLTTFTAVAVARVLSSHGVDVGIKWVNDIVADGKKVCGILAESGIHKGQPFAIVGIGVNCNETAFPEELSEIAVSLEQLTGRTWDSRALAEELLAALDEVCPQDPKDPQALMNEYRERSVTVGKQVRVHPHGGEPYDGYAVSITDEGGLVIRTPDDGEHTVTSGEVSVRVQ